MLEEFDGSTSFPSVIPSKVQAWIQIHNVHPLYLTEGILLQLASKIGEVIMVDMKAATTSTGDFHWARVNLLADTPLVRIVTPPRGL